MKRTVENYVLLKASKEIRLRDSVFGWCFGDNLVRRVVCTLFVMMLATLMSVCLSVCNL